MKIAHIGIYTNDIEKAKAFYETYFEGKANQKYINPLKGFESYFLQFKDATTLEIMSNKNISGTHNCPKQEYIGLAHLAFSVGSKEEVNQLTNRLRQDGYRIIGEPRTTGDGFYESVILDPDNNRIEITE